MAARRARRAGRCRGFVAVELVAALAFVLLPVVLIVVSLPGWAGRRQAAVVAADEAARMAARAWPAADTGAARDLAVRIMANHGIRASDVRVTVDASPQRGGIATARVSVRMPAIAGARAAWWLTVEHRETADLYGSRE